MQILLGKNPDLNAQDGEDMHAAVDGRGHQLRIAASNNMEIWVD